MIEKVIPDIYQKSIYYINYDKLYKKGIRCIIFDLDNTITPSHVKKPTKRLKKLFDELRDKGFKVIIMSNSPKHRIEPFKTYLNVGESINKYLYELYSPLSAYEFFTHPILSILLLNNLGIKLLSDSLIENIFLPKSLIEYPKW